MSRIYSSKQFYFFPLSLPFPSLSRPARLALGDELVDMSPAGPAGTRTWTKSIAGPRPSHGSLGFRLA